jgi:multiple sugar transport system permease protein
MAGSSSPRELASPTLVTSDIRLPRAHKPVTYWGGLRYEFKHSNKWAYLFIAPLILDFVIFTVYLVGRGFVMSFQDINFGRVTWVGLQNLRGVLVDPRFWNAMKNTVVFTLGVVPGGIGLGLLLSELIFRRSPRVQVFYKSAYYLPAVVSTVALSIVWVWIYQRFNGILNYFVSLFGMEPLNWLANPDTAMAAVIFMSVVSYVGVPVVFITAAMGGIPLDLYDAAKIDGASDWNRFLRVTVPLIRPTLLYLFVVGFIGYFQVFEQIYVMTSGGPSFPGATETVGFLIYSSAFASQSLGRAAAQSILLFLAILIFSLLQFRILATDVEY